ncbi:hypothetical protein N665_0156s0001 [Sinapis alba]|nr:hypothetical protein N665_0156s0001 [Sinapis alba]
MSVVFSSFLLFFTIITNPADSSTLHKDELKALGEIANTLGIKTLNLRNEDPCHLGILKFDDAQNPESTNSITCDCTFNDGTTCHITELKLKTLSLPGKLPPELVKLQYLQSISWKAQLMVMNL